MKTNMRKNPAEVAAELLLKTCVAAHGSNAPFLFVSVRPPAELEGLPLHVPISKGRTALVAPDVETARRIVEALRVLGYELKTPLHVNGRAFAHVESLVS